MLLLLLLLALLHLLLGILGACLLLLGLLLHTDINVDFVFFLIRIDLLRIVHIDGQVERLVLYFIALDVGSFRGCSTVRLRRRCSNLVILHWLAHGIARCSGHVIGFFTVIEVIVANLQRIPALLREVFVLHFLSNLNYCH